MMAEEAARPRLGRGLAALIGDVGDEAAVMDRARGSRRVPVEFLRPNPRNPRRHFAEDELAALADSIRARGLIQPIVARAHAGVPDAYEIVAGERRWRAAQRAGLHEVPVVVVDIDDKTSLEFAILENVQRADLNPVEEAAGYERLMREFAYSQAELGEILGKSRSHVANTLRLLGLPPTVQEALTKGQITAGHARALLSVKDPEAVLRRVVAEELTVREVEALASAEQEPGTPRPGRPRREKDADTRALERSLTDRIGLDVAIAHKEGAGELRIRYKTLEQLDALCRRLDVAN